MSTALKFYSLFKRGGAAFSPSDISGLALWLDASDATTLFQDSAGTTPVTANDDPVGYWGDKSGNARHATQTTTANKPLLKTAIKNGKNTVKFDATNDYLISTFGATLTQPLTAFLVESHNSDGAYFTDGIDGTKRLTFQVIGGFYYMFAGGAVGGTVANSKNTWRVWCAIANGVASVLRMQGVQTDTGNGSTYSLTGWTIGARYSLDTGWVDGYIGEMLLYDALLDAGQIAQVESYLNAKWSVY